MDKSDMKAPPAFPMPAQRPRRSITGMSAILLPFTSAGEVAWEALAAHIERTAACGLWPAVNMDTGYAASLDRQTRESVLHCAAEVCGQRPWVAGAFVSSDDQPSFVASAYQQQLEQITSAGGLPIVFQSAGLTEGPASTIVARYRMLAQACDRFLGFELGPQFAPFGRIYTMETYERLLEIPELIGAKHSSLSREQEWLRLALRDRVRPDFMVLTGNDLAIDMVAYGSDYLLGLSTFAPDLFALRDRLWAEQDGRFWSLNDRLQYLGCLAFREPVPAYKHAAAMFLHLRGWIPSDRVWPGSPERPASDRAILEVLLRTMQPWIELAAEKNGTAVP